MQDADYAARFIEMGVPKSRCIVTGTMKWDAVSITDAVPGADQLAAELGIDRARPLIVAGSTAEDEEALLHRACPDGVQLLCAPRKPEHFDEAAAALPGCVRRRSAAKQGAIRPTGANRFLLDTIGELRTAYSLADVVVIGPLLRRPLRLGPHRTHLPRKPVLIGPRHADFQTTVDALIAADAIRVITAKSCRAPSPNSSKTPPAAPSWPARAASASAPTKAPRGATPSCCYRFCRDNLSRSHPSPSSSPRG